MQFKKDERNEIKSTSHSRYRCQYHIVFAPKYRRKEIYGQLKKDIGEILRTLCKQKNVEILEAEACIDHIHMITSYQEHCKYKAFRSLQTRKNNICSITLRKKPSGMKNGRLFCVDRRKGGAKITTKFQCSNLCNFNEKEGRKWPMKN